MKYVKQEWKEKDTIVGRVSGSIYLDGVIPTPNNPHKYVWLVDSLTGRGEIATTAIGHILASPNRCGESRHYTIPLRVGMLGLIVDEVAYIHHHRMTTKENGDL